MTGIELLEKLKQLSGGELKYHISIEHDYDIICHYPTEVRIDKKVKEIILYED